MNSKLKYQNIVNFGKSINCTNIMFAVIIFVGTFLLMMPFRSNGVFCDEGDSILGGMVVANGGTVYKDFYSQHTPVMYYICGIFNLLGASSVDQYRMCLYALLSLIWVFMFIRYSKHFGKLAMMIYPFLFALVFVSNIKGLCNTVMADHIQAQSTALLFLELLLYHKKKLIDIKSAIVISLSIFLAFGSTAVASFSIAIFVVGMLYMVYSSFRKSGIGFLESIVSVFKKYWKHMMIIAAPFMIVLLIYASMGLLFKVYEQAIYINTKVYSKYIGGYGSNVITPFIAPISSYLSFMASSVNNMNTLISGQMHGGMVNSFLLLFTIIFNIGFILKFSKDKVFTVILTLFVLFTGQRGFDINFHDDTYWALALMMSAFMIAALINRIIYNLVYKRRFLFVRTCCFIVILGCFTFPYVKSFKDNHIQVSSISSKIPSLEYYINLLTEKNDKIWINDLRQDLYISTKRLPASRMAASVVPWMSMYEDETIEDLEKNKPKFILYDPNSGVWGHIYHDYLPNLDDYIKKQYRKMEQINGNAWIRNDYYDQAKQLIKNNPYPYRDIVSVDGNIGPIQSKRKVSELFIAEGIEISQLKMTIGTYGRKNHGKFTINIQDKESDQFVQSVTIEAENLIDGENLIDIPKNEIQVGKKYIINFIFEPTQEGIENNECITIFRTPDTISKYNGYAIVDAEKQPYNLCVSILYK